MKLIFLTIVILSVIILVTESTGRSTYLAKINTELIKEMGRDKEIEVIVLINKSKYKEADITQLGKIKHHYNIIPAIAMKIPSNKLFSLAEKEYVIRIEPSVKVKTFLQESTQIINATSLWNVQIGGINITGENVTVCILDTGVNYSHPDLGGCFGNGCKVVGGYDFVNNDTDPMDDHWHGTHVAGIVAANGNIKGVAPDAKIVAIKVLDEYGYGSFADVIAGIDWCVSNANIYNISVISMSLGTSSLYSDYCDSIFSSLSESVNASVEANITVVAAAGNDYNITHIAAPACLKNVIAVGSTEKNDTVSDFSNRNNITDLLAPGSNITSTWIGGGYIDASGTSMATPHVSGALALLYQVYKLYHNTTPSPAYLLETLKNTGKKINDTGGSNLNFSRIDVYAAASGFLDTVAPQVIINAPANNTWTNNNTLSINFTIIDNFDYEINYTLFVNDLENKTGVAINNTPTIVTLDWLDDGQYRLIIQGTDRTNNKANSTAIYINIDTVAPQWSNQSVIDTMERGDEVNLSAFWTDDKILSSAVLLTNETGRWNNISIQNLSGNSAWSNFTWNSSSFSNGTVISWKICASDMASNENCTDESYFTVVDTKGPIYFNIKSTTDAVYGKTYQFNITLFDYSGISDVIFEWNNANNFTVTNYREIDNYTKEYYLSLSDLAAGNYTYKWYMNDTLNNWNSTEQLRYTISKAPSHTKLFLNGTEGNKTYTIGEIINITATTDVISENVTINIPIIEISESGPSPLTYLLNSSVLNESSVYNITAYTKESENYTYSEVTYFIGICPICPQPSSWSSCSNGQQSRTTYYCNETSNYTCQATIETRSCPTPGTGISYTPVYTPPQPIVEISNGQANIVIPTIDAGTMTSIILNETFAIRNISIVTNASVKNAQITISQISRPLDVPKPQGTEYLYLEINKQNLTDITIVRFRFAVNKSWVEANNINESTITLWRYENGWNRLETTKISGDANEIIYESIFYNFSLYAITGQEKMCPMCPEPSNWSECINGLRWRVSYQCDATTNYTCVEYNEIEQCMVKKENRTILIVTAIILIVIFGVLIYYKFKRAWRDLNPRPST